MFGYVFLQWNVINSASHLIKLCNCFNNNSIKMLILQLVLRRSRAFKVLLLTINLYEDISDCQLILIDALEAETFDCKYMHFSQVPTKCYGVDRLN